MLVEIVIGFVDPSYVVAENGGQQQVCAEIKSGNLSTNVTVKFTTANGEAIGIPVYYEFNFKCFN